MEEKIILSYDISFEDYLDYNKTISELTVPTNRKRTTGQGIIITILAVLLVLYNNFLSDKNVWYTLIGVAMTAVGVYISLFYKIVAPKMLYKSVKKAYESDPEGFNNRIVTLAQDYFTDLPDGGYGEIKWDEVSSVLETQTQLLILFPDTRGVIIPKKKVDLAEVTAFLSEKMKGLGKEYLTAQTLRGENQ